MNIDGYIWLMMLMDLDVWDTFILLIFIYMIYEISYEK